MQRYQNEELENLKNQGDHLEATGHDDIDEITLARSDQGRHQSVAESETDGTNSRFWVLYTKTLKGKNTNVRGVC